MLAALLLVLGSTIVMAPQASAVPPSNDDFDAATLVDTLPFTDTVDVAEATRAGDDPSCAGSDDHTVWYVFTATSDATLVANTAGSDFDNTLSAWRGARGSLEELACSFERIQLTVLAGQTVHFMAAGFAGELGGTLALNIDLLPPPPPNDDIDSATVINALPFLDALDTSGATRAADDPECVGEDGRTVWYAFTAVADADLVAKTTGSSYGTTVSAYSGTRGSLSQLACNDFGNRIRLAVQAGDTVLIMIGSVPWEFGGDLTFSLDIAPPPPPNDDFDDATSVGPLPFTDALDITDATRADDDPTCFEFADDARTVWYAFTAPADETYVADTFGSTFDTALSVYSGTRGALSQLACNNDFRGPQSRIRVSLLTGETVFFMVGGLPWDSGGDLEFSVDVAPPPPPNDDFDDATLIESLPFTDSVDVTDATRAADDPPCIAEDEHTVWYSFTAPQDWEDQTVVRAGTAGSDYDTTLSAYMGSRGALTEIACSDHLRDRNLPATVDVRLSAGETVYFMAATFDGLLGGTLELSVDLAPQPPSNDDFTGATVVPTLPFTDTVDGSTATRDEDDPRSACSFPSDPDFSATVWYSFTASRATQLDVGTPESDFTAIVSAYEGTRGSLTEIACGAERMRLRVGPGDTVFIMVGGYPEPFDELVLTIDVPHRRAAGDLDTTFGGDGRVTHVIGLGNAGFATDVAVGADGRIFAASPAFFPGTDTGFAVVGVWPDGRLDPAFGDGGIVATDFGEGLEFAHVVAVQADGRIVVGGQSNSPDPGGAFSIALARYLPDGGLDPSFGAGGTTLTDALSGATDLVVMSGDRILVLGALTTCDPDEGCTSLGFGLARYLSDGTLDPTFGQGGVVTTEIPGAFAPAIAIQPDGRILVVVGRYSGEPGEPWVLARYLANGAVDGSFGQAGMVRTAFGEASAVPSGVTMLNGRIVVVGTVSDGDQSMFGLAGYRPNGALDPGFGDRGRTVTSFDAGMRASASGIALQRDGKIVVGGTFYGTSQDDGKFALARYLVNGRLDASFGTGGLVSTPDTGIGMALLIQSDGRIVIGGCGENCAADEPGMVFARYLSSSQ